MEKNFRYVCIYVCLHTCQFLGMFLLLGNKETVLLEIKLEESSSIGRVANTVKLSLPSYAIGVLSVAVDVVFSFMPR